MEIHTAVPPGAHKVHGLSHPPDGFHIRAAAFLPARVEYVQRVLERLGIDPSGSRALVVGSGRGLLARELARVGFVVSALDPAADAVRLAEEDGLRDALPVDHQVGDAERLPYGDGVFDVAYYQDTLETIDDLDRVLSEAARVLRAGGAFLYDTVNRTALKPADLPGRLAVVALDADHAPRPIRVGAVAPAGRARRDDEQVRATQSGCQRLDARKPAATDPGDAPGASGTCRRRRTRRPRRHARCARQESRRHLPRLRHDTRVGGVNTLSQTMATGVGRRPSLRLGRRVLRFPRLPGYWHREIGTSEESS